MFGGCRQWYDILRMCYRRGLPKRVTVASPVAFALTFADDVETFTIAFTNTVARSFAVTFKNTLQVTYTQTDCFADPFTCPNLLA